MNQFRKKPVVIEAKQATGTPESNREIIDVDRALLTDANPRRPDGGTTESNP